MRNIKNKYFFTWKIWNLNLNLFVFRIGWAFIESKWGYADQNCKCWRYFLAKKRDALQTISDQWKLAVLVNKFKKNRIVVEILQNFKL